MKRLLLMLVVAFASVLSVAAASPRLASEKFFDGSYGGRKAVTITISEQPGQYYRCITVSDDKTLMDALLKAFEQDRKRAEQYNEYHASSLHNRLISITNNGELIRVGVNAEPDGANGMLFITGARKDFE